MACSHGLLCFPEHHIEAYLIADAMPEAFHCIRCSRGTW